MEDDQSIFLLLASTVVFALLWSLWSKAAASERDDSGTEEAQSILVLERHNAALEQVNASLKNKLSELSSELDQKSKRIESFKLVVAESDGKLTQLKAQLQEKEVQKIQLSQLLRRSQRSRRHDPPHLNGTSDFSDAGNLTPYSIKSSSSGGRSRPRVSESGEALSEISSRDEELARELSTLRKSEPVVNETLQATIREANKESSRSNLDIDLLNQKIGVQLEQLEAVEALKDEHQKLQVEQKHLIDLNSQLKSELLDARQIIESKINESKLLRTALDSARSEIETQGSRIEALLVDSGMSVKDLTGTVIGIRSRHSSSVNNLSIGLDEIQSLVSLLSIKLSAKTDEAGDLSLRLSGTAKALDTYKSQCLLLEAESNGLRNQSQLLDRELASAKIEITKALASAAESKTILESESATLGSESRILRAHNTSLSSELETLKADLDAFMVENDQLNVQNELFSAAFEDLYACLGEDSLPPHSSNGGSEISFTAHQQMVPMKEAIKTFDHLAAKGYFAPSELSFTDASPLPRQLRFQQAMPPPPDPFLPSEQSTTPLPLRRSRGPRVCSMLWSSPVNTGDAATQRRDEEELTLRLNTIKQLASQVPDLRSQLSSMHRELLAARSEFEKLLTDADDARSDAEAAKRQLRDLDRQQAARLESLQAKLELAALADESMRVDLEKELEAALSKIEELETHVSELTKDLSSSSDDKDRAHDTVESLRGELKVATAALEELRLTSDALDGLRGDAEELQLDREKSTMRQAEEDCYRVEMEGTISRLQLTIEQQRSQIDAYVERIGRSVIEATSLKLQVDHLKSGTGLEVSDGGSLSFASFPQSHEVAVDSAIASAASSCGGGLPQAHTVNQYAYDLLLTASELSNKMKDVYRKWRHSISPRSTKDHIPDPPTKDHLDLSAADRDQDNLQGQFDELQTAYNILTSQIMAVAGQLKSMRVETI